MKNNTHYPEEENKQDTRAWFEKNIDEWTEEDEQEAFLNLFGNSPDN